MAEGDGEIEGCLRLFAANVAGVLALADLDRRVIAHALKAVEDRDERLRKSGLANSRFLAENAATSLRNIRDNDSMRPAFQELVNQCVVLVTSYFASAVGDLFRAGVKRAVAAGATGKLNEVKLTLTVRQLTDGSLDLGEDVGDLVAEAADVSFQDTKSIARAFAEFFHVQIAQDLDVNDIIAGLACRHVLVHNGGEVDRKCIRQLESALPRRIKKGLHVRDKVQFETQEVVDLSEAMQRYCSRIAEGLRRTGVD